MGAEFLVKEFHHISGVCCIITGHVESGEVIEGSVGRTSMGKKFTVVKIEKDGFQIPRTKINEKVNLSIKHLKRSDLRSKDTLYF